MESFSESIEDLKDKLDLEKSYLKISMASEESQEEIPDFEDLDSIFIIGDVHFQKEAFLQGEELIEKAIDAAEASSPSIIVLLGDILDTHETAKNGPWKQAEKLIEGLRSIAPLYVLMGNHDLIDRHQFLSDNHFFGPFKKWPLVTIVDKPIAVEMGKLTIIMSPYVPPGKFIEALDTLYEEQINWQLADLVLGHQEMNKVIYNGKESTSGDQWHESFPPLVLGHIHESCQIGDNVYYVGSARQVASNESPDKRVWSVTFDEDGMQHEEINLGLKAIKEVEIDYENVKTFDFDLLETYYIKLKVKGTREQLKLFRKSQLHAKLTRSGVRIAFDPIIEATLASSLTAAMVDDVSFEYILRELVKTKPKVVQDVYEEMYGSLEPVEESEETVYELVFVDG